MLNLVRGLFGADPLEMSHLATRFLVAEGTTVQCRTTVRQTLFELQSGPPHLMPDVVNAHICRNGELRRIDTLAAYRADQHAGVSQACLGRSSDST